MIMRPAKFWLKDTNLGIFLGTLSTKLEHFTHGGVAIYVSVATFDIGIFLGIKLRNGVVGLHELGFSLADAGALGAILNIGLGSVLESGFHEDFFYNVLNLFNCWNAALNLFLGDANHLVGNICGAIMTKFASGSTGFCDCFCNFVLVKRHDLSVALSN